MPEGSENDSPRITVTASDVEGVIEALGLDLVEQERLETERSEDYPEELDAVMETMADIYGGVRTATENDSRGRSRKMVREYADRDDLDSEAVGYHLRVLEENELVIQDGNRWRIAEADES